MAVDYTKVFTLIGKYVDKINDYYAYIATYVSDQAAIESTLSAQSVVRLEEGLTELYDSFKNQISSDISQIVDRITTILTDETLIGANFAFGQAPNLSIVWPAFIKDMNDNVVTIKNNAMTVGTPTYDTTNTGSFHLYKGSTLDGVTPPGSSFPVIKDYYALTSQLGPTSESFVFTCISDSESDGVAQGSETFQITGTSATSDGYSASGENIGTLGTITPVDNNNTGLLLNGSFDNWTSGEPDSWTTGATANYTTGAAIYGSGYSLKTIQNDTNLAITQTISKDSVKRNKGYLLTLWAAKDTDTLADQQIIVGITINGSTSTSSITPTTTAFEALTTAFFIPAELTDDVIITIGNTVDGLLSTNNAVLIDNVIISELQYYSGVAFAITCGATKVLRGDTATVAVTNNDAGKFQTFFRKAYGVQLPSSATPSISDSLVA